MPVINYWAVLLAGVSAMVVGGIWYGPLFGNLWMKGMGWDPHDKALKEKMKKKAGPAYAQMFVGSLLTAFVLTHVLWAFGVALEPKMGAFASAFQGSLWTWLGFVLPVKYGDKLWNGKKFKYVAVDLGYQLVMLFIMALIITHWK